MKVKKWYLGIASGLIAVAFIGYMAVEVIPRIFVSWTKAAPANKVAIEKSYLIGGDILAKADGTDQCRVNVFALDKSGKGVAGVNVSLAGMPGEPLEEVSNSDGLASFGISSATEGQFEMSASVNGSPISKTIKITFRN